MRVIGGLAGRRMSRSCARGECQHRWVSLPSCFLAKTGFSSQMERTFAAKDRCMQKPRPTAAKGRRYSGTDALRWAAALQVRACQCSNAGAARSRGELRGFAGEA